MLKKRLALVMTLCMAVTAAGCGNPGKNENSKGKDNGESGDKKVVSFYSWSENAEQDFDKAVIAQYEKENPDIDIQEVFVPYTEYLSKMNTMAAADSMPDVFKLPEGSVLEWGSKDAVLDLAPLYEKKGINLEETTLESTIFKTGDSVWGVGCNVATLALYYNKDLLKEAGIEFPSTDAENPWTWEEFVENARKLTKDSSGKTPEDSGFDPDSVSVYGTMMPTDWVLFSPLLYTNGAAIASDDGTELACE